MGNVKQLSISEAVDATLERFTSIAPTGISFDAEKGFAMQLLANNDFLKKAAIANPVSLQQAITNVAAIGLSLNPAERQAYLITRNVKVGQNQWQTRVFLEPSYMGLAKLATDSGSIKWVQANVVYQNDAFEDNGPGEKPTHKYQAFAKKEDRGDFVGVYCVAKTVDGDYLTTIMPAEEVIGIRNRSEAWKAKVKAEAQNKSRSGGPWETDFNEQAKKTVVRRAFKMWPRTNLHRMAQAVHMSNENEGFEPIVTSPNIGTYTAEQKQYFDQMLEKSDALGMYVFQRTLADDGIFTNLYHSFEKGQKGKYQRVVDELLRNGQKLLDEYVQSLADAVSSSDDAKVQEIRDELTQQELGLVLRNSTIEVVSGFEQMKAA